MIILRGVICHTLKSPSFSSGICFLFFPTTLLLLQISLLTSPLYPVSDSVSVSNFPESFLLITPARRFLHRNHNANPGTSKTKKARPKAMPMAAFALALRPVVDADCVATEVAVLDGGGREEVCDTAPKTVRTATLTTMTVAVGFASSAMCTAKDPFSPQTPQSGTLRRLTNQAAAADENWAGSSVAVAGLAIE